MLQLLMTLVSSVVWGQEKIDYNKLESEEVNLQTNGAVFLSGETVYISAFSFLGSSSRPSPLSKILYVTLVDDTGEEVNFQKIALNKGRGSGDIFLGTSLETGHYKLIAYTRWMLNFGKQHFFEKDLILINPYRRRKADKPYSDYPEYLENISFLEMTSPYLSIALNKNILKPRQPLKIELKTQGKDALSGSYALSVKKIDSLDFIKMQSSVELNWNFNQNLNTDGFLAPELRGALVSGKLNLPDKNGEKENKTVVLSFLDADRTPEFALTDDAGRFTWVLEELPTSRQTMGEAIGIENVYDFEIFEDPRPEYSDLTFQSIGIDRDLKNLIERRSVANQIENAYYQFKPDTIIETPKKRPFYIDAGKTFTLADFTRFDTLKETFTEIIQGGAVRTRNGKPVFKVETSNFIKGNEEYQTLLLVDGIFVTDNNFLYNYPARNIESITVVPEEYYIGPQRFSGVLDIRSFNADFKRQYMSQVAQAKSINAVAIQKNYFHQRYDNDQNQTLSNIPDYRYQLLWKPLIFFQNNSKILNCYTSDVTGMFEVVVSGFTGSGQPVFVKSFFEVTN
ncbi:hypothetical protein [Leeuwenhoekiella nanhaiensis]|nr:hypothetical protein [Leeuwenhoekiella nanhaiensis]